VKSVRYYINGEYKLRDTQIFRDCKTAAPSSSRWLSGLIQGNRAASLLPDSKPDLIIIFVAY